MEDAQKVSPDKTLVHFRHYQLHFVNNYVSVNVLAERQLRTSFLIQYKKLKVYILCTNLPPGYFLGF